MSPETFIWKDAPLSSPEIALGTSAVYLAIVIVHRLIFGSKPPGFGELRTLQAVHNFILCLGSLIMLLGCLYEIVSRSILENSMLWLLCEHPGTTSVGSLWFWSYLYYLSKFYELFDTILQLLRGKLPPNYFLHAYHHSCVIIMCWFWLEVAGTMQFIAIIFNTAVHVVMYFYFFLRSIGKPPKWKTYVTMFQIVQFMTSIVCFIGTLSLVFIQRQECNGMNAVYGTLLFNVTLLYGFISLLLSDRKSKRKPL